VADQVATGRHRLGAGWVMWHVQATSLQSLVWCQVASVAVSLCHMQPRLGHGQAFYYSQFVPGVYA
jgi:hypothetical protein